MVESITDLADSPQQAQEFASHFYYQSHDVNDTEHYIALRELQNSLDEKYQTEHNKVFFLSMAPQFLEPLPNTSNQKELWMDKALSA